ncbi:MAG: DUF992 domain-containing protein [Nitratireductor sp.]|jgi:hypothetical protein|nr:DUF992 domain-containing protein [Nitratireductor sp.]
MKRVLKLAALATAALAIAGTAQAQNIRAGTLTCEGKGSIGLLIGSREALTCTYQPASGAPARRFAGTIGSLGISIGVTGPSVLVWGVLASSNEVPNDMLTGRFVGVSADASLGIGAGAQVLVGGTARSVVLQPLSVKGQVGVNVAAGVTGLTLRPL